MLKYPNLNFNTKNMKLLMNQKNVLGVSWNYRIFFKAHGILEELETLAQPLFHG